MADQDTPATPTDPAPETPKASWIWLKDSAGYPSITVTFVTVGFWVTTLWYMASIVSKIGHFEIRPFDPSAATAYLSPLLALYFGRKWTDSRAAMGGAR